MRAVFYTLSALTLLVVVSLLANVQHEWARSQENAALEINKNEKIMHAYNNIMEQVARSLGTSFYVSRDPWAVRINTAFVANINTTDLAEIHAYHLLGNVQRMGEFATLYGEEELNLEKVVLNTSILQDSLVANDESFLYSVEPYGFDYEWKFVAGSLLDDRLEISRQGVAGDRIEVTITGAGPTFASSTCCTAANLTFGNKGNITVFWAPTILIDFSKLDFSRTGVMTVNTTLRLPPTDEKVRVAVRGVLLNMTHQRTHVEGNSIFIG